MAGFCWRYLSVTGADHEPIAGGFDNLQRDLLGGVEIHDPPHLGEQPFDKPKVAAGQADDGGECLDALQTVGIEGDPESSGVPGCDKSHLGLPQRLELMYDPMREWSCG